MTKEKVIIPTVDGFIDAEEEALHAIIESDDYVPVSIMTPELRAFYSNCAKYTNEQKAEMIKIDIELSLFDLKRINNQAKELGMPSNVYVASLLHQAVSA